MRLTDNQFKLLIYNKLVEETYKSFVFTNKKKYIWFRKWFLSTAKRKTKYGKERREREYDNLVRAFGIRYQSGGAAPSSQRLPKYSYRLPRGLTNDKT